MFTKKIGQLAFLFIVPGTAFAAPDMAPSVSLPSSSESVVIQPSEKLGTPSRVPRRDTRSPLYCSSADAAPQLADRVGEGSCRSHTKEHQAESQKSEAPNLPTPDIHAITGR